MPRPIQSIHEHLALEDHSGDGLDKSMAVGWSIDTGHYVQNGRSPRETDRAGPHYRGGP
jgi:hypothetical protein